MSNRIFLAYTLAGVLKLQNASVMKIFYFNTAFLRSFSTEASYYFDITRIMLPIEQGLVVKRYLHLPSDKIGLHWKKMYQYR